MHSGFSALRSKMPMNCRASDCHVELTVELAEDIEQIQAILANYKNQNNKFLKVVKSLIASKKARLIKF